MSLCKKYHYFGAEPHVTVKTSYGAADHLSWLPECQRIIEGFGSFSVTVGELRYFGDKECGARIGLVYPSYMRTFR